MTRLWVDGRDVAEVTVASTWGARARGMLWRRRLPEAMWFERESSVHGVGMTVPLDVAQLAADGSVLAVHVLRPFGLVAPRRGAVDVIEAPAGSFARWGLAVGGVARRVPAGTAG